MCDIQIIWNLIDEYPSWHESLFVRCIVPNLVPARIRFYDPCRNYLTERIAHVTTTDYSESLGGTIVGQAIFI